MVYNPDTWATEAVLSEAEHLRRMLVHYFENGAGEAFWKTRVVPLIEKLAATTIRTSAGQYAPMGVKAAVALTGDFIVKKGAITWVRNKTAKMIVLESTEFVAASMKGLVAATNVLGWVMFLSPPAGAETERQWEYNNYLAKYLTQVMKSAALGGNHLKNLQPPLSYPQFQNSSYVEWWLRE